MFGRHARRRTDVQRNGAHPSHLYCGEIRLNGQATRRQFLLDRSAEAAPAIAGDTGNRDRPAGPVVLAVEVAVAFQLDEVRTDIIPPPTVHPIFRPFVLVAREAALRMHAIDRCTAPDQPRLDEQPSDLQSLMRNTYAVYCLKNK